VIAAIAAPYLRQGPPAGRANRPSDPAQIWRRSKTARRGARRGDQFCICGRAI
jgi:hypothetical protein